MMLKTHPDNTSESTNPRGRCKMGEGCYLRNVMSLLMSLPLRLGAWQNEWVTPRVCRILSVNSSLNARSPVRMNSSSPKNVSVNCCRLLPARSNCHKRGSVCTQSISTNGTCSSALTYKNCMCGESCNRCFLFHRKTSRQWLIQQGTILLWLFWVYHDAKYE